MKNKMLQWFCTGKVGLSSKAMVCAVIGLPCDGDYPRDPDDLNRCLLLLEMVPEVRRSFHKIAAINDQWRRLIARWNEVEQCFVDEVGLGWSKGISAPRTYDLMQQIQRAQVVG